eukprot:Em0018g145a
MSTSELQQRSPEETHQDQLYTLSLGSPNEADISASVMGGRCSPVHDPHKSCISAVGTMCAVCGDVAPGGSTYRRHYGVICCEACKCFFRRTVQMNRDYKCRYGSNCSVGRSPVNMKQVCQACRFNQCVKAGMKVDSVKKFPRKGRDESVAGVKKLNKQKGGGGVKMQKSSATKADAANQSPMVSLAPVKGEEGSDFEDHFEQIKLTSSSSPETSYQIFDTSIPQLFNYDTAQESILTCSSPAKSTPGTGTTASRTNSTSSASPKDSPQHVRKVSFESEAAQMKRGGTVAEATNISQLKKPKLESARTPVQQTSAPNSCRMTGADAILSSSTLVHSSTSSTPYTTPHGTPCHSPLPNSSSPHHFKYYSAVSASQGEGASGPCQYHPASCSQMDSPSPAHMGHVTLTSRGNPAAGNIIISSQPPAGAFLPFHVVPVGQVGSPLFPMVHFTGPFPHQTAGPSQSTIGKSPFHIVPIPTNSKPVTNGGSGVSSPESISHHPSQFITMAKSELVADELGTGTCSSSQNSPGVSKLLAGNSFLEAEVEEVLDSLRLRIRHMFKWAKFEVMGFEDLSPLDQKALLRRTVAELVMLGFARGSIPYDGLLVLGSTGKVIRPRNPNCGVATVASVTLQKLVVPLQALNIDEKELNLLKEIVLFNPEADRPS